MYGCFARNLSTCCFISARRPLLDFDAPIKSHLLNNPRQWSTYLPVHHQFGKISSHGIFYKRGYALIPQSSFPSSSASASFYSSKSGFLGWYLELLQSRPLITKAVTTSLIYIAADLCSQMFTLTSIRSLDLTRTLRMGGYGLLILGPAQHLWFNCLSNIFPKRDVLSTLKKIFMGQAIFGPFVVAIFFTFNSGLQGESVGEILARLNRDLLSTLLSGLMYWPICDFVTYKFIPVRLQPLLNSSCAFFWTIYLTYMASLTKVSAI